MRATSLSAVRALGGWRMRSLDTGVEPLEVASAGPLPATLSDRFMRFWEWRRDRSPAGDELTAFGWWFASGRLPYEWGLQQLRDLLKRGVRLGGSTHVALPRLRGMSSVDSWLVGEIARELVARAPLDEDLARVSEDLFAIATALEAPTLSAEVQAMGAEVESRLLSRGYDRPRRGQAPPSG